MLGYAVGVIGLGFDDFCALTPAETAAVFTAYRDKVDGRRRDAWERMRMSACIGIQPHVKKKITPTRLLPLPWDRQPVQQPAVQHTKEERRARRDMLLERFRKSHGKGSQV